MTQNNDKGVDYQKMESFFSNGKLFDLIWRKKWLFAITIVAAGILATIFSGPSFITPKYKSESIIYPINLNEYGDESLTEQMLQILQSTDLKLKLIDAFDLYEHYEIDPNVQFAQTYIFDELNDHVSFSKTSYESVRITILDKDPQQAADIADSINIFYNQLVKSIKDEKTIERIDRDAREMKKISLETDSLRNILESLRASSNLVSPHRQTKEITRAYLNKSGKANEMYNSLIEHRDDIIFLDSLIYLNNSRYYEYKDDHDEQVTELNRDIRFSSVISKPIPADKKSYPVRWLILAGSMLAAFVFCLVVLIILEAFIDSKN